MREGFALRHRRVFTAVVIGLFSTLICFAYRVASDNLQGDLYYPICASDSLSSGLDPYGPQCDIFFQGAYYPTNPLTTTLMVWPFTKIFPPVVTASVLIGLASGILAYGITRDNQWWRLLIFSSATYWQCVQWSQWGILIAAVAVLPNLMPLILVKPHIGLPIFLTNFSGKRLLACLFFAAGSLVIFPNWPFRWLLSGKIETYSGFVPVLVFPIGLALLGAWFIVWRYPRNRWIWMFALYTVIPQRAYYDLVVLWLLPRQIRTMLILSLLSWVALLLTPTYVAESWAFAIVGLLYIPLMIIIKLEADKADCQDVHLVGHAAR